MPTPAPVVLGMAMADHDHRHPARRFHPGASRRLDRRRPGRVHRSRGWPRPRWPSTSTAPQPTSTSPLPDGAQVAVVTADTADGRHVLRHSTAHVLAQAVTDLWPGAQYAIGPAIEDGFYYDFELPGGAHFSEDDLRAHRGPDARDRRRGPALRPGGAHASPRGSSSSPTSPTRSRSSRASTGRREPRAWRQRRGQRLPQHRRASWTCAAARTSRPPGRLGHFKLTKVAAAYWRGDEQPPAAAAHLRHGVGVQGRPRRAPAPPGGGREARPPPARAPSSTCSTSRPRSAAGCRSSTPRAA